VTRVVGPSGDLPFVRDGVWVSRRNQHPRPADGPAVPPQDIGFAIRLDCRLDATTPFAATIHDVRGRRVRELDASAVERRGFELLWDGRDARGEMVANGIYFARVQACGRTAVRRLAVVR
jgi:hypothetical protein